MKLYAVILWHSGSCPCYNTQCYMYMYMYVRELSAMLIGTVLSGQAMPNMGVSGVSLSKPQDGHDVYCTCVRACAACVPAYMRVGEACLETSEVSVAVLGSDGWPRTSAEGQESGALEYHVHVSMKVKFAPEQPWVQVWAMSQLVLRVHARAMISWITIGTFMSITTHWEGVLNTRIHAVTI